LQKIILTKSQKKILSNHASNEKPNESCAILLGTDNKQEIVVKKIILAKNIDESPVSFTISNEQLLRVYKTAEEEEMNVVGIFHSHPNSEAYPSSTDKKFMYSNPVAWIIYSGISNDFKAYKLESDVLEILIETSAT